MDNRYVILGDTHLGISKSSDAWHEFAINLFKEIVDLCVLEDIKYIIHTGDFFHERKSINTKTLDKAQEIEHILGDIEMLVIVGNHDTFYKDQLNPTSLQVFKDSKNIQVIDEMMAWDNITFVPWGLLPEKPVTDYCIGHFEINGFHMNNSILCKRGINASKLKEFKHVFSGHFHTPSTKGNITYLGAPYAQTFNDLNGIRGYYILDKGELNFIEYLSAPKFIRRTISNIIGREEVEGNIVKLVFDKDHGTTGNAKIVDDIMEFKPFQLHTDFSQIVDDNNKIREESTSLLLDNMGIMREYISGKEVPENIKKRTLVDMIEKLVEEIE